MVSSSGRRRHGRTAKRRAEAVEAAAGDLCHWAARLRVLRRPRRGAGSAGAAHGAHGRRIGSRRSIAAAIARAGAPADGAQGCMLFASGIAYVVSQMRVWDGGCHGAWCTVYVACGGALHVSGHSCFKDSRHSCMVGFTACREECRAAQRTRARKYVLPRGALYVLCRVLSAVCCALCHACCALYVHGYVVRCCMLCFVGCMLHVACCMCPT